MPIAKTKKRKKNTRMRGKNMGTHGWGARKKHKKSGHRGGSGMAGTGKRSDQKKTLITKVYGHGYFGKKGVTSRASEKDKRDRININEIEDNLKKYGKETAGNWSIELKNYKVLGGPKDYKVKNKLSIVAKEASKSAIDKAKAAGGEIQLAVPKDKSAKQEELKESPKAAGGKER